MMVGHGQSWLKHSETRPLFWVPLFGRLEINGAFPKANVGKPHQQPWKHQNLCESTASKVLLYARSRVAKP